MIDASVPMGRHLSAGLNREETKIPWESPTLRVVLASTLLAPLGVALISPGLPVIRAQFSLTDAETSLMLSSYFVTGIVLSPLIGILEDRIGRRAVLIPSLLIFSLMGAAIAYAPSYLVALGLRIVQGTAAAGIFISTVTLIGDAFEGVQRTAVLGANTAVLSAGAAIFPILGGILAGQAWNAPFFVYLVGVPVALLAYVTLDEPAAERATHSLGSFRQVFVALSLREALLLYGSAFMIEILLFGSVFTAIPFLLSIEFGVQPVGIGITVTAALITSAVAASQAGSIVKYTSDETVIILGFACASVGLLFAWGANSPSILVLASAVFGAGWGLVLPSIDDEVSEYVPIDFRAEALSLRNSTTFLGRTLAPILFTALATMWGYRPLLLAAGVAGFASGLIGLLLSRWRTHTD